ncbi:MAG TPA: diaminopimelate decarboxylase [Gammaproteobacteria bacterium]|nr:diaminopimelate decarboxylase [Gammaproteobacteria bacterium]
MKPFDYRHGRLHVEQVDLQTLAEIHGTPAYIYSAAALRANYGALAAAFGPQPHRICYAVKANGNLAVLQLLAGLGAGFDIVSVGELERVLLAGGEPERIVFSGVGKREAEMRRALEVGIGCFNVESASELRRLDRLAQALGQRAPVSLRVNPDVDAATHPYIATGLKENKFGIDIDRAAELYGEAAAMPGIRLVGIDCHIGSQLTTLAPFVDALERVLALYDRLQAQGIELAHIDVGGGLGIRYRDEQPPAAAAWVGALRERVGGRPVALWLEPGRAIVGEAGVLLTRVEYLKVQQGHHFAIVDAGMNDLLRPSLYQAWHDILPVSPRRDEPPPAWDIVGPVCETGDFLGKQRELALAEGDLLAVMSAGAYAFTMASQYNARPRPPELLVDGAHVHVARARETLADLWAGERLADLPA